MHLASYWGFYLPMLAINLVRPLRRLPVVASYHGGMAEQFVAAHRRRVQALAQMRAQRAADPANAMPVVDPNVVPFEAIAQMTAFLHSLTDPCLRDRSCFGRWIATPEEAPDSLQLNAVNAQGSAL